MKEGEAKATKAEGDQGRLRAKETSGKNNKKQVPDSKILRSAYLCAFVCFFIIRGDLFDYKVNYLMYEFTGRGGVRSDLGILAQKK